MTALLHSVFGIFGNVTGLFLFLSPLVTFKRIIQNKGTEQFSGVPYIMTLLNCLLSAWYGMPFVSSNNILVAVVNGVGTVIESIYVIIFLVYSSKKEKMKILGLLSVILTIFGAAALVSFFALHHQNRKVFCGFAAAIFSVIMYGSPLSVMRLVMKTKSVEYMPFLLSLCSFLCGTSWFVYGLLGKDPFLAVPNGFGCALGILQLIVYAVYCGNKGQNMKTADGSPLELGQANGSAGAEKPTYDQRQVSNQEDST
ncbi:bidirectional sugar transporter SWEET1-like [Apium graveolens]|uniref:bidirectional sugar transporter SWEET1-like n=1 Tax=Apium graveolens TaxID=4045 RepID=UPI003D7A28FA